MTLTIGGCTPAHPTVALAIAVANINGLPEFFGPLIPDRRLHACTPNGRTCHSCSEY
jgi:hypothetical protein